MYLYKRDQSKAMYFLKWCLPVLLLCIHAKVAIAQKPAKETVFFQDNFSDNRYSWPVGSNKYVSQSVENGKYKIHYHLPKSHWRFFKQFQLNSAYDFKIEADLKLITGSTAHAHGLLWGTKDQGNNFNFTIASNGLFKIWGYKNATYFVWQDWLSHKSIRPINKDNKLSIQKKRNTLIFYINDVKVYEHPFEVFHGDFIGFVAGSLQNIEVDNFIITQTRPEMSVVRSSKDCERTNLGNSINSSHVEISPIISPDGNTLYISRRTPVTNVFNLTSRTTNCDVWFSERQSDNSWSKLQRMDAPINNLGDNLVISVSTDGRTLLLEGLYDKEGNYAGDQGISISKRTLDEWSIPKKVEIADFYNQNEYESYGHTADLQVLIMSLQRDDTYGAKDLYVSFRQTDGTYSAPRNMGNDLNTNLNEGTPFIAADNKTLYFYSHGHPGYGSADIFMSRRLDDTWTKWSTPKNMGPCINGKGWDTYYSVSARGDYAYLVSIESPEKQEDIFVVKLDKENRPEPVVLVKGRVLDKKTGLPLKASISFTSQPESEQKIKDHPTNKSIPDITSDQQSGKYSLLLPIGYKHVINVSAPNYLPTSSAMDLSKNQDYKEITLDLFLIPIELGKVIALNNVQFKQNKSELLESSFIELNHLVQLMNDNVKMEIELTGHTETRGNRKQLQRLSEERVEEVKAYLVKKGIHKNRISGKGYGSSQPLGHGNEETERLNRRVEMKITQL